MLSALKPASVMACVFGFLTVMVCAGLVVPTVKEAKLSLSGVASGGSIGTGAPAPVSAVLALPCGVVTLKLPVALPMAVGVKVMLMTQLAPAARLAPQVLVCAKPKLLVSVVTVIAVLFGLLSVAVCGRLGTPTMIEPKLTAAGLKVGATITTGGGGAGGATAVPLRVALTLPAEVVAETAPVGLPATVGLKLTVMVQLAFAASVAPQVVVWVKPAPVVATTVVMLCGLGLLRVSTRGVALAPTVVLGKVTADGARIGGTSGGSVAVPETEPCAATPAMPMAVTPTTPL